MPGSLLRIAGDWTSLMAPGISFSILLQGDKPCGAVIHLVLCYFSRFSRGL